MFISFDEDSKGFWNGLSSHRVMLQQCTACGTIRFPYLPGCPSCREIGTVEIESSGLGRVYSWIRVWPRNETAGAAASPPYVIATVDLDEGCRIFGRLMTASPEIGQAVKADYIDHDSWTELLFTLLSPQ
jgi:uncharacterized protein